MMRRINRTIAWQFTRRSVVRIAGSMAVWPCMLLLVGGCGDSLESADRATDGGYDGGRPAPDNEERPPAPGSFVTVRPAVTENYVYVANSAAGSIARVALETGSAARIRTARVGSRPTQVVALPAGDAVAVLNADSGSVSIVRTTDAVTDRVRTLRTPFGVNQLRVSPDGNWAVVWFDQDPSAAAPGPPAEVGVLRLTEGAEVAWRFAVGTGVREARFSSDSGRIVVLCDDGVSQIDLLTADGDGVAPPSRIAGPTALLPQTLVLDASLTWVAWTADSTLFSHRLTDGRTETLALEDTAVSLALRPGTDEVLLGLADAGALWSVSLAGSPLATNWEADLSQVGTTGLAPSPDGSAALVWQRGAEGDVDPLLALVNLADGEATVRNVRRSIVDVVYSHEGRYAVLAHGRKTDPPPPGAGEEARFARESALTIFDLQEDVTRLVLSGGDARAVTFSEDGQRALVLVSNQPQASAAVQLLDFETLRNTPLTFGRLPLFVGMMPGGALGFVVQSHELGRISFVDLDSGDAFDVTGFELNALIE